MMRPCLFLYQGWRYTAALLEASHPQYCSCSPYVVSVLSHLCFCIGLKEFSVHLLFVSFHPLKVPESWPHLGRKLHFYNFPMKHLPYLSCTMPLSSLDKFEEHECNPASILLKDSFYAIQ
ncbi:hypothetical protein V8G54_008007 [Vigna mungo]|uniref:Uncharacterized protein n=1 Tax=Vigna mungo TaxID=3915 RepID=A0AAQ3P2Y6_VIGMU